MTQEVSPYASADSKCIKFWNDKPVPKSLDDMKITVRKVRKDIKDANGKTFYDRHGSFHKSQGEYIYYPACDQSALFVQIASHGNSRPEVLTEQNLTAIEALGFDIRVDGPGTRTTAR